MSNEAHEKGIRSAVDALDRYCTKDDMEAAIKAYLDASGLVMVRREPTEEMHTAWENGYITGFEGVDERERLTQETAFLCFRAAHHDMISAFPNLFESKQDE